MRRRNTFAGLVAAGAAMALVLSACAGEDGDGEEASRGFEDCADDPNNCNSGDAEAGGEMIWTTDVKPDGYFAWSPEGGSVYTLQATHGILPDFGTHDPSGEYQYNMDVLAAEPEVVNEDPLTVVYQIREEAVWNDGTPVNANDAIAYWMMSAPADDGLCEGCNPRATDDAAQWESIEGSDDGKTLTITYKDGLQDPEWFAFGSTDNAIGGLPPAHVGVEQGFIEGDDPTQWDPEGLGEFFEHLDSNPPDFSAGPWMIESFDLENEVVKVPNPDWYGEVQPTLERLTIRFLDNEDTWAPAIQNGELHGANPAGWSEDVILQMQEMDNVLLDMRGGPSWEHIDLNLDNEWLQDVELRRAIFTAIDRQELLDRNFGQLFPEAQLRNNHMFSQDSEFYVDQMEGTGQGTGDVELARETLQAAGYEGFDGEPGDLSLDGETVGPFRLRSTTAPARETNMQLIQNQLAEIGIQAEIEPTDDLGATLGGQDYDIMEFGWSGSPLFAGDGGQFWETGSGSNFGQYSNEQVDALAEQERAVATQEESADLHNQMMEILVPEAYVLPLYDSPVYLFVIDGYVNVRENVNTSLRGIYNHHEWGVAAE